MQLFLSISCSFASSLCCWKDLKLIPQKCSGEFTARTLPSGRSRENWKLLKYCFLRDIYGTLSLVVHHKFILSRVSGGKPEGDSSLVPGYLDRMLSWRHEKRLAATKRCNGREIFAKQSVKVKCRESCGSFSSDAGVVVMNHINFS